MASITTKRSRATAEQLSLLVDFLLENPGLAEGKFMKLHGKFEHQKKWSELAAKVNSVGGGVKTVDQWHSVWNDLKCRTSVKVRERRRQQALTGNRPISQEPISELEKRVVALIGEDYIKGHESVKKNVPLEEELQLRIEDGDEDVIIEFKENLEVLQETPKTLKTPRRCLKRKRLEEDSETRDKFLEIAKQQADSLKMLAECNKANVEASKMITDAVRTMGEGLMRTADALNNLASSINRLL